MKKLKIVGIILLALQAISLFPALISGDNIFLGGIPNLIGRLIFGIVGVILLIIAHKKENGK